jgi:hypothetical protein
MASYPSIEFPNNIIPEVFNKNSFVSKALKSDDVLTSSLNVLGPSTLNTLQSNTINNTGDLVTNTITSNALVTCNNGLSVTGGLLNYGSFASSGAVSCNNGFSVTSGTVAAVSGVSGRLTSLESSTTKLINYTSGNTFPNTISSNTLSIDYSTFNNRPILVTASANFSITVTNVPITSTNAHYRLELFITNKFYCNSITVNGTVIVRHDSLAVNFA